MKKQSFHEILTAKMGAPVAEQKPVSMYNELLENISAAVFQIDMQPVRSVSFKAYPSSSPKKKIVPMFETTPVKPKEIFIAKSSLNDDEKSVWNLFEKTVGKNLGETTTRAQTMSAFRSFAKKNHPDVAATSTSTNFAHVVKVKNEMLAVLDKKIKSSK